MPLNKLILLILKFKIMENLIATFKTIDLQHLSTKSEKFRNKYKELLEEDGKSLLVYSGHFDQNPFALSYEEYDEYLEKLRNEWLIEGKSWLEIEELEEIESQFITGIKF